MTRDELAGFWRIKLGRLSDIYSVDDDVILVEVVRVRKRTPKTYAVGPGCFAAR